MNRTPEEMKAMLGKRVRVYLDQPQADGTNATIVEGQLLGFGQCGDFEILDNSDGFVHYCWPMLLIEEITS